MAKAKRGSATVYVCTDCGEEYLQWQGRCNVCGAWNTLKEFKQAPEDPRARNSSGPVKAVGLAEVAKGSVERYSSGIAEVDRVLGGGIVPGSVILLGGDPGIGKSTLLLQMTNTIKAPADQPILYVSGEESPGQIKLRADRLGVTNSQVQLLPATEIGAIEQAVEESRPFLLIVDSIQTLYDPSFPSTPGSIVQVRETALRLQQLAKAKQIPVVLVGHITKEGTVAGPRTLEHLVDTVLYLEGDEHYQLRILRAVKNRFGDVSETGLFAMESAGLQEVLNPTDFLIHERVNAPGCVLTAVLEGNRPMLIEVQALTTQTVFGYPRRTASGFDVNRLNLLLAILQRRAGIDLSNQDVFVNVVGGLKIKDPAVDAAVCVALASAASGKSVPDRLCVIGEVGLAGELRKVAAEQRRRKEIEALGYSVNGSVKEIRQLLAAVVSGKE